MQPLAGITVLDFTTLLPGPLATLILAEAGADVIKIEPPGGDPMRTFPPCVDGHSVPFAALNRGKRTVTLDLKSSESRVHLASLLARADVLVEQFRPGVMDRLDLGYETLRALNPRIVYCSISGYGQSGPRSQEAGHDLNYIGTTGLLALNPGPREHPTVPPALIADIGGCDFPAVLNVLLGLRQRDATGQGCHIDIAMTDAMFTFAWHALITGLTSGAFPGAGEAKLAGGSPRYRLYPTRDDKIVACAALEPKFWEAFTRAIELDPRYVDDAKDPHATAEAVAVIIRSRTAEQWRPILAAADCCVTIVASLDEAVTDPHFVERKLFSEKLTLGAKTIPALPVPVAPGFRS